MKITTKDKKCIKLISTINDTFDKLNSFSTISNFLNKFKIKNIFKTLFQEYTLYLQEYSKSNDLITTLEILKKRIVNISEQDLNNEKIIFHFYRLLDNLNILITHLFIFKNNLNLEYLNNLILNNFRPKENK